jgi:GT2 family glycosyltransferase
VDNLTLVIPYRDEVAALTNLLGTLANVGLPVIVVDDVSDVLPRGTGREKIIRLKQRGYFSGAVNAGIAACSTDVLVLNQDTAIGGVEWLKELEEQRREYAIIGTGVLNHPAWPEGYVQGVAMFLRRDAIRKVGLLDAARWPLWGATAEWQLRACRAGFKALPLAECHWVSHSRKGKYPDGAGDSARPAHPNATAGLGRHGLPELWAVPAGLGRVACRREEQHRRNVGADPARIRTCHRR